MNPISSQQSFAPFTSGAFAGSRSVQAEQTLAGSLSLANSTDLTITTAEGDRVTLSLATAVEVNTGLYRSQSIEDDRQTSTQTAFFEFSDSQSMAIAVDGDLNAQELEDIREAVGAIGGMIEDFLSGDLEEMAADGELLKELDTISSLEAAFSTERQVVYGEQEKVTLNTASRAGGFRRRHHRGHGRMRQLMNHIDHLTDRMAQRADESGSRRKQVAKSISGLLHRYGRGETTDTPAGRLNRQVVRTVESIFVQKMETRSESADFTFAYTA